MMAPGPSSAVALVTVHTQVTVATVETSTQALPPPTIITSSVTPPATSPTVQATTPTHPLLSTRRDSTTQCGRLGRRDSRSHASPERASRATRYIKDIIEIQNLFLINQLAEIIQITLLSYTYSCRSQ